MNALERKKTTVVSKYASEYFSEADWLTLGQITGHLDIITGHGRLLRSLSFGDEDYGHCAAEVIDKIFNDDPNLIRDVIDHFDIDLWFEQKDPVKYQKIFLDSRITSADFWKDGYYKLFISHLSSNKVRMSAMKEAFLHWGIYAFIAHDDIEPTREWRNEIEVALESMDVMVAVVEPGFKKSDWCCQEVGYALGRKIDIVPLRAGKDPFGFFGKYQGIQVKGKTPTDSANEVTKLLLKKPNHRPKLIQCMTKAFTELKSSDKTSTISLLDSWNVLTNQQLKGVIERSLLSDREREPLTRIIKKVGAFTKEAETLYQKGIKDDIPF